MYSGLPVLHTGVAVQRSGVLSRQLDVRRDHVQGGAAHPLRQRGRVLALHSHDHHQQVQSFITRITEYTIKSDLKGKSTVFELYNIAPARVRSKQKQGGLSKPKVLQ